MSPGRLTIIGDLVQTATSRMVIEIGGAGAGQSVELVVTGDLQLGGDLIIRLINGFIPDETFALTFLQANGVTGAFANIDAGVVDANGGTFDVVLDGDSFRIENFQQVPEPASVAITLVSVLSLVRRRSRLESPSLRCV